MSERTKPRDAILVVRLTSHLEDPTYDMIIYPAAESYFLVETIKCFLSKSSCWILKILQSFSMTQTKYHNVFHRSLSQLIKAIAHNLD